MRLEGRVDIIPDQAGTDIIIHNVGEPIHRDLYSSGGRKLGI
jgi:hypothetical protein